jgi:hypothetical protein
MTVIPRVGSNSHRSLFREQCERKIHGSISKEVRSRTGIKLHSEREGSLLHADCVECAMNDALILLRAHEAPSTKTCQDSR